MRKTTISLNDRQDEMINEIMSDHGYKTLASIIDEGIRRVHKALFPEYVRLAKDKEKLTPEEIARKKLDTQDAKEKAKEDREREAKLGIVDRLGGKVSKDEKYCEFTAYTISRLGNENRVMSTNVERLPMSMISEATFDIKYKSRTLPMADRIAAVEHYKKAELAK